MDQRAYELFLRHGRIKRMLSELRRLYAAPSELSEWKRLQEEEAEVREQIANLDLN